MEMNKKVKINILTGFFGSGKTTMISNIVKAEKLHNKIAIVQNEFSDEMGIEKEILTDGNGNSLGNLYELANGCMCCAVKDNIIVFLENLIIKKSEIEIVIIESHGISDMSLLLKKFWLDQELESPLYLNSIICFIDCFHFEKNKSEMYEIFVNQIISADKILLNKLDQINYDKTKIHLIKDFISSINPLASITETEFSKVTTEYFLEDTALNIYKTINFNEISNTQDHLHSHYHEKEEIENIVIPTNLKSKSKLDLAIGNIIWDLSEKHNFSIIRFKGIFYEEAHTQTKKYSIQGLYDLYEINEIPMGIKRANKKSKILFIGRKIRENENIIKKILNEI